MNRMCQVKAYKGSSNPRIDKCMINCINTLDAMSHKSHIKVVACCCGHGKYPRTIVVQVKGQDIAWELLTGTIIPRKKKFYKRDEEGYYYIPEVVAR